MLIRQRVNSGLDPFGSPPQALIDFSLVRTVFQSLEPTLVTGHEPVTVHPARGVRVDGFNYFVLSHSLENSLHRVLAFYPRQRAPLTVPYGPTFLKVVDDLFLS